MATAHGSTSPLSSRKGVERATAVSVVGALLVVEAVAVAVFLFASGTELLSLRYTLYPFVWINAGVWVLLRRPRPASGTRRRLAAAVVAAGYFLVLAVAGGLVGHGHHGSYVRLVWLSPGWGPMFMLSNGWLDVTLLPFEAVGYLALATLVYTVLLAGSRASLAGLLGISTCVGCLWPLGVAVAAALGAVGSPLATTVPTLAYDLSTVLFVGTIAVLHWATRRTTA